MADALKTLPLELRILVREAVALLGGLIRRELGQVGFSQVERLRRRMASLRIASAREARRALRLTLNELRDLEPDRQEDIARAYTLMLELMNACENAYRAQRAQVRTGASLVRKTPRERPQALILVLTAHPTEARSPQNVEIYRKIQEKLREALSHGFESRRRDLDHLLSVAWRIRIARNRKPSVSDEAGHIYSVALTRENISLLLEAGERLAPVYLRSWVGGDKDGHPDVDERTMLMSLQLSREKLLAYARFCLGELRATLALLPDASTKILSRATRDLDRALLALAILRTGDGRRVLALSRSRTRLIQAYENEVGSVHPALLRISRLLSVFPALVIPLELRESAELVVAAAGTRMARGTKHAIARMVRKVGVLARGGADPRWYARGFILSMAATSQEVLAGLRLVTHELGFPGIPVIPLFEQKQALEQSETIVDGLLRDPCFHRAVLEHWEGRLEVMVGYSDSAKESGVLPSRLAIADALARLDRTCRTHGVLPIFFHGSGGSVDRGGGNLAEQTAWWPRGAFQVYKTTIQGEMVARLFASPEITWSHLEKTYWRACEGLQSASPSRSPSAVRNFAARVEHRYRATISDPAFLELVQRATAYRYLSALKIGSRPAARSVIRSVNSLRAIPWVLSWTQVRVLFPTWWGTGSAWRELDGPGRKALQKAFREDPLFSSTIKALGFTLAKVELAVWQIYLEESGLPGEQVKRMVREFERELAGSMELVRALSGSRDLLWFRPWLGESIRLRSPMIHPLNLIQILALEKGASPSLIRETVTGISSGMMTTG